MSDDRILELERRIQTLEGLVRGLLKQSDAGIPVKVEPPPQPTIAPARPINTETIAAAPAPAAPRPDRSRESAEQWVGLRGVLAAGVGLVILAAVFGLKWAIDHGYISAVVRCIGGGIFGAALAAIGWHHYQRNLSKYGSTLIGLGCAIIYLVVWAAGELYGLIPPMLAIAVLGVFSILVALVATSLKEEALGIVATAGAISAPLLIPAATPSATFTLLYLAPVIAALGGVAFARAWRRMAFVVAIGFVLAAMQEVGDATPLLGVAIAVAFGIGALEAGRRRTWPELRMIGFAAGWLMLARAGDELTVHSPALLGAVLLALPTCLPAFAPSKVWPDLRLPDDEAKWSIAESGYFYIVPVALTHFVALLDGQWFATHPGFATFAVALPYLFAGYQRPRITYALASVMLLIMASADVTSGPPMVWVMLGLAAFLLLMDQVQQRRDGRWLALIALTAGLFQLQSSFGLRPDTVSAFIDKWAITAWLCIGVLVAIARQYWPVYAEDRDAPTNAFANAAISTPRGLRLTSAAFARFVPQALWLAAGVLLFAAVSVELSRLMGELGFARQTAQLAAGLAVSAWWAVYAGVLVIAGFRRGLALVRIAGLCVAAVAVAKVILFDLAQLDALYRIASFLILGLVLLGVAYLYHQQARTLGDATSEAELSSELEATRPESPQAQSRTGEGR